MSATPASSDGHCWDALRVSTCRSYLRAPAPIPIRFGNFIRARHCSGSIAMFSRVRLDTFPTKRYVEFSTRWAAASPATSPRRMSLLALDSFLQICEHFEVPHRYLLTATMAIQPVYWATSTSTIDFIWALGCFLIGFRLLLNDRYFSAATMLGLAVGIRLSSVLLAGPLLIWQLIERPRDAKLWTTAIIATSIGAMLYLPEFIALGKLVRVPDLLHRRMDLDRPPGRFIYKNVYFWGLPAMIFLLATSPLLLRGLIRCDPKFSRIIGLSASIVIIFEMLFLKIPVQRAYLLPMLPFALILLGIALRAHPRMLLAIAILTFGFDFVNLNLARPDRPNDATRAIAGPFIEPGYLFQDLGARLALARNPIAQPSNF